MVRLPSCLISLLTVSAAWALAPLAGAATVAQQVLVNFDGTLSGTTYTLGTGELDTTSTFQANGSATISGGVADVPGDADAASGFYFDAASLGSLTTQSWVSEMLFAPDVATASQPGEFNHFLDVQGDLFFRYSGTPKITQFGFFDGADEPTATTPDLPASQYSHVALTWDATTNTLEAFINGVSQGALSTGNPFETPSTNVGYGFFSRTGFLNRAVDGKLDAVAFSTYTGAFDSAADFQLMVVPEPGALMLLAIALAALPWSPRKRDAFPSVQIIKWGDPMEVETMWNKLSICFSQVMLRATMAMAVIALLTSASLGAVKERVYTLGDDDPGATIGQPVVGLQTNDIQPSATDARGSLVHLTAFDATTSPVYVDVSDRPGAAPGSLGVQFDGVDDYLFAGEFDPRNFGGSFAALTQAWVKPAAAGFGTERMIFRTGAENGGASINADGFFTLYLTDANIAVGNIAAVPDEWMHVAVIRGGNAGTLYVNGRVAARSTGFWGASGPEVSLGANILGFDSFFQGAIDNFNNAGFSDGLFNVAVDIDYFSDLDITFSGVAGDIDQDGVVDEEDYQIWSENVGLNNGFGVGDPGTLLLGDADQSGRIDLRDFQIINQEILAAQQSGSTGAVVPEPATVLLLLTGLVPVVLRRARFRSLMASLTVVSLTLSLADSAKAVLVVADDYLYDGQTKTLNVGGGFNGNEQYLGGQNGPAGSWTDLWGQIGDGIITTTTFDPPDLRNVSLYDGFFGVQSELLRNFALADSVSPTQTLYFGGQFKVELTETPQFFAPRMFLNRVPGDDNDTAVPLRDRTQDIAIGIQNDAVVARLGAGTESMTVAAGAAPNDGEWHTVIGKLELNVAGGANERLTVWLNPTGVETGGTMAQTEADILPDLTALIGTLHMQGSVPSGEPALGRSYIDDVAIGTAWEDVVQVDVPRLTLRIDPTSGNARIINNSSVALELNSYSIESDAGSLNAAGWNSLDNQNLGDWQENLASDDQVVETFLLGSTPVSPGGQLPLGNLFTTGAMEDVTGRFGTLDGLVNLFLVEFGEDVGVIGDYNGNGVVDAADYTVWRDSLGGSTLLNRDPSITGPVSEEDYDAWAANFGATSGSGTGAGAVPEPGAVGLLLLAAAGGIGLSHRKPITTP